MEVGPGDALANLFEEFLHNVVEDDPGPQETLGCRSAKRGEKVRERA